MSRMWYYSDKKQQKGPIPFEELRGLAHSGYLKPSDLVWEEGTPDWIRASLVDGLFEAGQAGGFDRDRDRDQGSDRDRDRGRDDRGRDDRGYDDTPRGRRRDPDYDDRPRRREIARKPEGMSSGLKIGLIVGGIALVLIVVAVILIIVLSNSGPSRTYTITLRGGMSESRTETFRAGQTVEIRVNTVITRDFAADVDLDVFDPTNMLVARDEGVSKDCVVNFRAVRPGPYRINVRNLGPGDVRSTVTVR